MGSGPDGLPLDPKPSSSPSAPTPSPSPSGRAPAAAAASATTTSVGSNRVAGGPWEVVPAVIARAVAKGYR